MNTWYNLTTQGQATHVDIYGDIGSWNLTAEAFIAEIGRNADKELVLNISSLGGSVNDALQIHDFLSSYPKKVTAKITGLTASSATIIAMAANEVLMSENALFLIHNVWSPFSSGNAEELEKEAESLRQIDDLLINIYKKKTKRAKSTIAKLMAEERWLDAEEALNLRLIDKLYVPSKEIVNSLVLNKIEENKLPELPINYKGLSQSFINQKFEEMSLEKINDKIDLIINKIEGLFNSEEKVVEVLNKSEVEATLNAEIEELKNLYEFQIDTQKETIDMANESLEEKNRELVELRNSFEENLKDLTEKVEKLEAVETKAVREEDAAIDEKAPDNNPFDNLAEKLRW